LPGFIEFGQYPPGQSDVDSLSGVGQQRSIDVDNCPHPPFALAVFLKITDTAWVRDRFVAIQGGFNRKPNSLFGALNGLINAVICSRKAPG
jgi:hypothetical protein